MTGADASAAWLDTIRWPAGGLLPAVVQAADDGTVLMLAWMNRAALAATMAEGRAVYWSRSRGCLWRKGERSGHVQLIREIRLDCDADALLLVVEQVGGIACHTGRRGCFYRCLVGGRWTAVEPVLKSPDAIYGGGR